MGIEITNADPRPPTAVVVDGEFVQVDIGTLSACAVENHGQMYCWGHNEYGQLATGGFVRHDIPVASAWSDWQRVTVASDHACGIRQGALYCWGENLGRTLGTGEGLSPMLIANDL